MILNLRFLFIIHNLQELLKINLNFKIFSLLENKLNYKLLSILF